MTDVQPKQWPGALTVEERRAQILAELDVTLEVDLRPWLAREFPGQPAAVVDAVLARALEFARGMVDVSIEKELRRGHEPLH